MFVECQKLGSLRLRHIKSRMNLHVDYSGIDERIIRCPSPRVSESRNRDAGGVPLPLPLTTGPTYGETFPNIVIHRCRDRSGRDNNHDANAGPS